MRYAIVIAAVAALAAAAWTGVFIAPSATAVVVTPPPSATPNGHPHPLRRVADIPVTGPVAGPKDVSGLGLVGDFLALVSDETAHVELLRRSGDGFASIGSVPLGAKDTEVDLEAVAVDGDTVYAIGSHSRVRPKQNPKSTPADNRRHMSVILGSEPRDVVSRFRLAADGTPGPVERASLRAAIDACPVLAPFVGVPGKENGVDIEGLALKNGQLYVGFRSPVLRENLVPILVTTFHDPSTADVRFINLGGRGVRDLAAVADGFLILAGPPGDGHGSYQIYHWDGNDCLEGATPAGRCALLIELPPAGKGKPEGLAVAGEDAAGYDLILAHDGIPNGGLAKYRLNR